MATSAQGPALTPAPLLGDHHVSAERELGLESLRLLEKMLRHPTLAAGEHQVFFDQGLFRSATHGQALAQKYSALNDCILHFEQDSRAIAGIQLADLAAHTCAVMLLEQLGLFGKTVKAGHNSGYEPDLDIELGFELWARIRDSFLSKPPPHPDEWKDDEIQPVADVTPFGLHVSDTASNELRTAAIERFGSMYLGCIH